MAASSPATTVPSLYVGDLHPDVGEQHLLEAFGSVGSVTSARICRDSASFRSLGYGYVNFISPQDASRAIEKLNHSSLFGNPMRIMWSHRDPDARSSGIGNLFVKVLATSCDLLHGEFLKLCALDPDVGCGYHLQNLSDSIDSSRLHEMFSKFGTIWSCKVATYQDGRSKGYGYVQFDNKESSNSAIEKLNGSNVDGKQIYVGNFIKKNEQLLPSPESKFTNLYMKNLDQDITEELIELKFSEFGKILNVMIANDADGNSKGFGFVNFENPDGAKRAMESMNGVKLGSKTLYVARAQKKAERLRILQRLYEEKRNEQIRKNMNLYVKNIADGVDDSSLKDLFAKFGNITSAKVMLDDKGMSKGFGFVCYTTPEDASNAVNSLHGEMFHGKPLYVAIAQRKEDRQAQLQLQYGQRMTGFVGSQPAVIPSGYPPIFYSQGIVPQVHPQQGLIYHPFGMRPAWRPSGFVPSARPAFQPMPHPMMPNSPRQSRHNRGWMNGHMLPQSGHAIPYLQQSNHSLNSSNDFSNQQRSGQTKYVPNGRKWEMTNGLVVPHAASDSERLSSMLANATFEEQKGMLGERLYPLVEKLKYDLASKITGMLLEMDNSELLLLLESSESLAAKVEEAVQVLELAKTKVGGQDGPQTETYLSNSVAIS